MTTKLKQLSKQELLDMFDESVHEKILEAAARYPDAEAIVVFENVDMSSSRLGERSALVVGPSNTFTNVEDASDKWLGDLPSERQYPTAYWPVEK